MSISEKMQNNNDKNNSIVNIQTSLVIKEKGCEIKLNNDFFNDLSKIMENSEFNSFFKKYMTVWISHIMSPHIHTLMIEDFLLYMTRWASRDMIMI